MFFVAVDDLLYNGKAQPCALLVFAAGDVGFVESVPDQFQVVFGDADAAVLDGGEQLVFFHGGFHLGG